METGCSVNLTVEELELLEKRMYLFLMNSMASGKLTDEQIIDRVRTLYKLHAATLKGAE